MLKLFVMNITGLDSRWIRPETMPFLAEARSRCPAFSLRNYPSNDILPSILTGTYPPEHGIWGVRLKESADAPRGSGIVPDILTTSVQCMRHWITGEFDLSAIPPWRRKRFEITRSKYRRFARPWDVLSEIGGRVSVMGAVGRDQTRYQFRSPSDPVGEVLPDCANGDVALDWLELYTINRIQQWYADSVRVGRWYGKVDEFVKAACEKCANNGVLPVLVNEHGHEPVRRSIDLQAALRKSGLADDEYSYFLELPMVRFWFHTERARETIGTLLGEMEMVHVFRHDEMGPLHLDFGDTSYGELFGFLEPGNIFFPHDFHHPLGNFYLGLGDRKQWPRIADARQRSNCGYLPGNDCEKGIFLVFDESLRAAAPSGTVIDVAPTLLSLLEVETPDTMKGTVLCVRGAGEC
ncbi:MAG: hypothetical protein HKN20_02955 [Gemmatimonadetes bacterium]|nr:hypothetical protein [Gemmatimonadota bacterium]